MTYVDGYVLAIAKENLDAYREMADKAGRVWQEHGALKFVECVAEDDDDKGFCQTFRATLGLQPGETTVFSYVVFESRQHRDEVNAKVMDDPRIRESCSPDSMPFDCKRMSYGGFTTIVDY